MRETSKRTVAKALTWQVLGLVVMTVAGYWMTGSLAKASGFSLALQGFSVIVYILHERLWGRVHWGLQVGTIGAPALHARSR